MARHVVLLASGGGHTGHAVALGQRLKGKAELLFIVPKGDRWSARKVSKLGKVMEIIKARGPKDPYYVFLPRFIGAYFESIFKLLTRCEGYEVIVSGGSNHSIPPSMVGKKIMGMKLVSIESSVRFTRPSGTAKLLERYADITVLQWPEQKRILPKGEYFGPLIEYPEYPIRNEGYVLVTGGTYGHKELFEAIVELGLKDVVLQTGRVDPEPYRRRFPGWVVFRYDPDFGRWLAGADVVITHLGKTVIDAALAYRKPTIIVYNPEWRRSSSVGVTDALALAKKLNAVLVLNPKPKILMKAIEEARLREPPKYPDGAERLARKILNEL